MELSTLDLDLLVEAIDNLYGKVYEDYKQNNNPYNFSRVVDAEQLRKKLVEERQRR